MPTLPPAGPDITQSAVTTAAAGGSLWPCSSMVHRCPVITASRSWPEECHTGSWNKWRWPYIKRHNKNNSLIYSFYMFKSCLFHGRDVLLFPRQQSINRELNEEMWISIPVIDVLCFGVRFQLHPLTNGPQPHYATVRDILDFLISLWDGNIFAAQEVTEMVNQE